MNPKKIRSEILNEEYYFMKHPTGLNIFVYPKKGYSSKLAIFGTHFGSINNKFKIKGQKSFTQVPDGIAHFLEHKLFEGKDGQDAFTQFSKTGANPNAYTSWDKTAYHFSCTENFEKSLEILLNFVQNPYFTEENVKKEQGIIAQEIKMYDDEPESVVLLNLLKALYKNHQINLDIAGTVESISGITPEILYECYNAYYNLNNMSLCVVGDVEYEKIFMLVDKQLNSTLATKVESFFPDEPAEVAQKLIIKKMDISTPLFYFGFKEPPTSPTNKFYAENAIIKDFFSSKTSPMYNELLKAEIINTASFDMNQLDGPGYSCWVFGGESKNAKKATEIILKHTEKARKEGIERETFERVKKSAYAESIASYDSISSIANILLDSSFYGRTLFGYTDALINVTQEDINNRLKNSFRSQYSALSIVEG